MVLLRVPYMFPKRDALLNNWKEILLWLHCPFYSHKALFFKTQYLLKCIEGCSPRALMFLRPSVKIKQGRRSCVRFCFKSVRCRSPRGASGTGLITGKVTSEPISSIGRAAHGISMRYWKEHSSVFGSHTNTGPRWQKSPSWRGAGSWSQRSALHPALAGPENAAHSFQPCMEQAGNVEAWVYKLMKYGWVNISS